MGDRIFSYDGELAPATDILSTNINSYISQAKLAAAILGTSTLLNNFSCTPTTPASMSVTVGQGEMYILETVDTVAYGDLGTNSNQIVKQGIVLTPTTLSCPAPLTAGQSINYLIEFSFNEVDTNPEVLLYYNASNPASPYNGPGGSGTANFTLRQDTVIVQVKAGVAAPSGTQTTPSADAGFIGGYVVTVANGQSTITSGNISVLAGAPFITETLTQKISQTTADARYAQQTQIQSNTLLYTADTSVSANTVTASLSPAIAAYTTGMVVFVKIANTNTGASTINLNSLGAKNIVYQGGSNISAGDLISGYVAILIYNGTNFEIANPGSITASNVTIANIQSGTYIYVTDSGVVNAYAGNASPAITSYTSGMIINLRIVNTNTGASTFNLNGLGAKTIAYVNGTALNAGELLSGKVHSLLYNGTNFELLNPATLTPSSNVQTTAYNYAPDSGSANAYIASLSPTPIAYTTGMLAYIKIAHTNTSTSCTINLNGLGSKPIKLPNGNNPNVGDLVAGQIAEFSYDGTNMQLLNAVNANLFYAADGGSANTYTVAIAPVAIGKSFTVKIANTNTGSSTLNANSTGAITIINKDGSNLIAGQLRAGMVASFVYDGTNYQLQNPDLESGIIREWAAATYPSTWQICDGSAISRTTYAALFAAIGTTWGVGDGSTTFNVPDLRGRTAIGSGTGSGLSARTLAATGGEETHILSVGEMPSHNHAPPTAGNWLLATPATGANSFNVGTDVSQSSASDSNTGGGGAHNNMQPFAVVTYLIRL